MFIASPGRESRQERHVLIKRSNMALLRSLMLCILFTSLKTWRASGAIQAESQIDKLHPSLFEYLITCGFVTRHVVHVMA
jgi:hypothetical protein